MFGTWTCWQSCRLFSCLQLPDLAGCIGMSASAAPRSRSNLSERKYETYMELLNIFFDQFKAVQSGRPLDTSKLTSRMFDAGKNLMIFGSDDVAMKYEEWL